MRPGRSAVNALPTMIGLGAAERVDLRVTFTDGDVVEASVEPGRATEMVADP